MNSRTSSISADHSAASFHLTTLTAQALERVRTTTPLVHSVTNSVVTNFTANVLLALGAAPAMVDIPTEAGPFAAIASGVLVNLGTPQGEQRQAMREAATSAHDAGTPWVLDPVAIGVLPVRTAMAAELLTLNPRIIRGNASEIAALAGAGQGGRGVDSTDSPDSALPAAITLATQTGGCVAISGPVDIVTDGTRVAHLANGTPLLTKVTGGGCALGAVMAAFAAVVPDPFDAAIAATTAYNIAAERAAVGAAGPGSFSVAFLDQLSSLGSQEIVEATRITVVS